MLLLYNLSAIYKDDHYHVILSFKIVSDLGGLVKKADYDISDFILIRTENTCQSLIIIF